MTRAATGRKLAAGLFTAFALWSGGGGALALAGPSLYTYDELGRLTSVTKTTGLRVTYNYDAAGNRSSVTIVDVQPPSAPGTLSGFAASATQINLSWGAATDNVGVTSYRVYRNGSVVGTPTGTSYSCCANHLMRA
jgi:YD repeat-containing protein